MGPHLGARSPSPKTDSRAPRQHQAPSPHPAPHRPPCPQAAPGPGACLRAASPSRLPSPTGASLLTLPKTVPTRTPEAP